MTDVVCYYHDPIKAPLLRDGVLPALAAVSSSFPDVAGHVERHWLHGPHLRVRLFGPSSDTAALLLATLLRSYLAAKPSTVELSAADQLAHARTAAVAELLLPPFTPLHPNNSVRVEPTSLHRLRELLPSEQISLRFEGLRLGVPVLRSSLAVPRATLALTAMAVHASRYPGGLRYGYHTFLSHVEDFLLADDPSGAVRARLDALWTAHAAEACALVSRVATGHPTTPLEAAWQTWTIALRLAAEPRYDAGLLDEANPRHAERAHEIGDPGAIRRYDYGHRSEFGDYHTALWNADLSHPETRRNMTVYRLGTNVLYQLLAICDVTPLERYAAAHLLARAAQQVCGTTWAEQFAALPKVG
ncbi:Lantibiotic biosynthesis dehydratase C-term [Lentzea xinjiangensis]|uniref:Lantibiotic biosynthesis dehydratase C-term n=1 Tax=Lentzea xinjiangensis TaxID=402600 RepID=A0A1H9LVF9_9PSEU|nr:lantibiotic dehydratase C-terminal domain-containing protein [Lentzea xinjiangensis]SER15472.1 Lantibiotic biosynthesis dehydratase C-term [Lentzea xinjiangensis]